MLRNFTRNFFLQLQTTCCFWEDACKHDLSEQSRYLNFIVKRAENLCKLSKVTYCVSRILFQGHCIMKIYFPEIAVIFLMPWSFETGICHCGAFGPLCVQSQFVTIGLFREFGYYFSQVLKTGGRNAIISRIEELEQQDRKKSLTKGSIPVTVVSF